MQAQGVGASRLVAECSMPQPRLLDDSGTDTGMWFFGKGKLLPLQVAVAARWGQLGRLVRGFILPGTALRGGGGGGVKF